MRRREDLNRVLSVVIDGRPVLGDRKDKMTYDCLAVAFGGEWDQLASVG